MAPRTPAVLVTGASGYVGRLLAAALLEREPHTTILAPVRKKHDQAHLRALFASELETSDAEARARMLERIVFLPLPPTAQFATELVPHLQRELRDYEVTDIVHSAGCLSYYNAAKLHEGNEVFTGLMLELARSLSVEKFVYMSSAFASGYIDGPIGETLHDEPASDPNEYTKSKRRTERLVAASGVPFQIHRPSAVVGSSRDGRYSGKPYGAYQMWTGLCRFLCDRPRSEIHIVAPDVSLNLVHQDAVQAGFHAAFRTLPVGTIINLVSRPATAPTTREFWHFWMEACGRPDTAFYYDQLDGLDLESLDERQRLVVDFAECNIEISSHDWQFETGTLDALRRSGLDYPDATRASSLVVFNWFLARNSHAQAFMAAHAAALEGRKPRIIPVPRGGLRRAATGPGVDTAGLALDRVEIAAG
jgi:nucleoside-diphosphate-sugar epimerase